LIGTRGAAAVAAPELVLQRLRRLAGVIAHQPHGGVGVALRDRVHDRFVLVPDRATQVVGLQSQAHGAADVVQVQLRAALDEWVARSAVDRGVEGDVGLDQGLEVAAPVGRVALIDQRAVDARAALGRQAHGERIECRAHLVDLADLGRIERGHLQAARALARALRDKFPGSDVAIEQVALSDREGTVELHMPVVDGVVVTGCSTISSEASETYPASRAIEVPMDRLDAVYKGRVGFIKIDVEGHEQAVLDGAVQTIRRCRPRLLVEVDDRLSPGGLARARAYFDRLGYTGHFVRQGKLEPIAAFSIEEMQRPDRLPDLTAPLTARKRFGSYIYNFIFLPADEPASTMDRISARLATL